MTETFEHYDQGLEAIFFAYMEKSCAPQWFKQRMVEHIAVASGEADENDKIIATTISEQGVIFSLSREAIAEPRVQELLDQIFLVLGKQNSCSSAQQDALAETLDTSVDNEHY